MAALLALTEPTTPGAWFDVFWTFGPTVLALLAAVVIGSLVLRPAGLGSRILSHPWLATPAATSPTPPTSGTCPSTSC
ncbi:hypothetical protein J2808_000028 [Pseudarthrobacter sulfonivorans]|nr:hypothetical protein [Pseudarthrobacter sulfonivorans]